MLAIIYSYDDWLLNSSRQCPWNGFYAITWSNDYLVSQHPGHNELNVYSLQIYRYKIWIFVIVSGVSHHNTAKMVADFCFGFCLQNGSNKADNLL